MKFLNFPKHDKLTKRGTKYYFTRNSGLQDQAVWYSLDEFGDQTPQVFLDPNKLHPNGTTSLKFTSFSPDNKYFAYGLSEGGSDWNTIRIKDTNTLQDLPEELTKVLILDENKSNKIISHHLDQILFSSMDAR